MSKDVDDYVWQDREIRFDVPFSQLQPRKGEIEIDSINAVEDTKGNNGEKGALSVTNLRLIWCSTKNPQTNLSIGLSCIVSVNIRSAASKLRGTTAALFVMTKYQSSRFEFIFTSLVKNSPRLFTTVQAVVRSYETTRLYRDLKLRGAIIKDNKSVCFFGNENSSESDFLNVSSSLLLLPNERIFTRVEGVWNLSSDQGNLGAFFITNVRLVWRAVRSPLAAQIVLSLTTCVLLNRISLKISMSPSHIFRLSVSHSWVCFRSFMYEALVQVER